MGSSNPMDNRLETLALHDCLHGFTAGRGTGTAIMEVKLAQQLAHLKQVPLYGLFIDLRKVFDAMDRKRCLQILEDRGVSPKIRRLIQRFWSLALLVCKAGGCYGRPFLAGRGVTQGGPLSPRIFNLMVDAVMREWLRSQLGAEVANSVIGDQIRTLIVAFCVSGFPES